MGHVRVCMHSNMWLGRAPRLHSNIFILGIVARDFNHHFHQQAKTILYFISTSIKYLDTATNPISDKRHNWRQMS